MSTFTHTKNPVLLYPRYSIYPHVVIYGNNRMGESSNKGRSRVETVMFYYMSMKNGNYIVAFLGRGKHRS